jgi:hypothetical protein
MRYCDVAHAIGRHEVQDQKIPLMKTRYLLCVSNKGHEASLIPMKVYKQISDSKSERNEMVRVIDEDGEDYVFPARMFVVARFS